MNPNNLIKTLFKLTDLDSCYPINMIMLDNGTFPKLFSWKEALQAHLDHEIVVRTKIHQYHFRKIYNTPRNIHQIEEAYQKMYLNYYHFSKFYIESLMHVYFLPNPFLKFLWEQNKVYNYLNRLMIKNQETRL